MEKIFITVIVLYALFVGIYLLYLKAGERRKKDIVGKGTSLHGSGRLKTDIIGKSRFDLSASKPITAKSEPLDATSQKSGKVVGNQDKFVPPNEVKPSAEVPQEELDEAFSDTPSNEDNEPMDIDYPLEYETSDENEDGPEDEDEDGLADKDEESEEVEGAAQAMLASGVGFDDLGNVVRTIEKVDKATSEQKQRAGKTLLELRQTDMFEQVVSGKPDAKRIVTDLMAESLAEFHRRKDKEAGTSGSGKKVPENFNIRDFA